MKLSPSSRMTAGGNSASRRPCRSAVTAHRLACGGSGVLAGEAGRAGGSRMPQARSARRRPSPGGRRADARRAPAAAGCSRPGARPGAAAGRSRPPARPGAPRGSLVPPLADPGVVQAERLGLEDQVQRLVRPAARARVVGARGAGALGGRDALGVGVADWTAAGEPRLELRRERVGEGARGGHEVTALPRIASTCWRAWRWWARSAPAAERWRSSWTAQSPQPSARPAWPARAWNSARAEVERVREREVDSGRTKGHLLGAGPGVAARLPSRWSAAGALPLLRSAMVA